MDHQSLERELGLGGAIVTGLGSILGTGAFVAIALASSSWGDVVLVAVPAAALVASFNGLSSAFLAGRFPVAGGTYEYGYRTLGPWAGFAAGWLFLLAKTASAATAALGIALYLGAGNRIAIGVIAVGAITILVVSGLRRSTWVNTALVLVTVSGLLTFTVAGLAGSEGNTGILNIATGDPGNTSLLGAIAFLFVAYTGYGRIATLGEEVKRPARTIPIAVVVTLVVAALLYMGVELGGRSLGGEFWGSLLSLGLAPADLLAEPYSTVVAVAAVTAMLGVLLNLILGLSRVWLAMGRRGDMPAGLAKLDSHANPTRAVLVAGLVVALVVLLGDLRLAWSFSAMTVLLYYALTNLAALQLNPRRPTSWAGLASCVFLSFFVPLGVWLVGVSLLLLGAIWKGLITTRS